MRDKIKRIRKPIIFFLPKEGFDGILEEKELNDLQEVGFLNTLVITEIDGATLPITKGEQCLMILEKDSILKNSVLEFLHLKSELNESAFYYLYDDYMKNLSKWIMTAEFVKTEAKTKAKNYFKEVQSYLELQHKFLKLHQKELNSHFGDWKMKYALDRFNKSKSTTKKTNLSQSSIPIPNNIVETATSSSNSNSKKKKKLSVAEVDDYLLKSVFNVEIDKNN